MGLESHIKRQVIISTLFTTLIGLNLPNVYGLEIVQTPKKLCDSLTEACSLCENYAFGDRQFNVFPGIPKFNEYITSVSHEYLSDVVDNFIKKQDEVMESCLTSMKNNSSLMFAPVESLFKKKPDRAESINKHIQRFVECIRNKTQKDIRDALEKIKNSTLNTLVSDSEDLLKKIKHAESVSFINLADVFGHVKCFSIFSDVQKCCSLKYLSSRSNASFSSVIASNPSLNLKDCEDFKTISDKFLELDQAMAKQEREVCA